MIPAGSEREWEGQESEGLVLGHILNHRGEVGPLVLAINLQLELQTKPSANIVLALGEIRLSIVQTVRLNTDLPHVWSHGCGLSSADAC